MAATEELTARPGRFLDENFKAISSDLNISELVSEALNNFDQLFEEEKKNAPKYSKAWSKASKIYESVFENLNSNDKKFLTEELSEKLPDELKANPQNLTVAVIAYTMEHQDFFQRFNETTKSVLSREKTWESFRFKSFFILLTHAIKWLPSRPNPKLQKTIFRGLNADEIPEVGQIFSLGQLSSFSPKRRLALGKQPKYNKNPDVEDENETEEEPTDDDTTQPPKMLLRVMFGEKLEALGMRHLSPFGAKEVEVLVAAHQKFKVKKINEKSDKGFTVVVVQPVE